MKATLVEYPVGFSIHLNPETDEEKTMLFRFASNTKPDKVEIAAYFNGPSFSGEVSFQSYNDKRSSVRNSHRRKR